MPRAKVSRLSSKRSLLTGQYQRDCGCLQCVIDLMPSYRIGTVWSDFSTSALLVDTLVQPSNRRIADPNHRPSKESCEPDRTIGLRKGYLKVVGQASRGHGRLGRPIEH